MIKCKTYSVKVREGLAQVFFFQKNSLVQGSSKEFSVVDVAVAVHVQSVNRLLNLVIRHLYFCYLYCLLKFFVLKSSVTVHIHRDERVPKVLNRLLRKLSSHERQC